MTLLQVRIQAVDNAEFNQRTAIAMLTVKIIRNFQPPIFDINSQFKAVKIPEDMPSGVPIVTLLATDGDNQSPNNDVRYRYRDGDNNEDATFFQIDPVSGEISVDKSLSSDLRIPSRTQYTVGFCYF